MMEPSCSSGTNGGGTRFCYDAFGLLIKTSKGSGVFWNCWDWFKLHRPYGAVFMCAGEVDTR